MAYIVMAYIVMADGVMAHLRHRQPRATCLAARAAPRRLCRRRCGGAATRRGRARSVFLATFRRTSTAKRREVRSMSRWWHRKGLAETRLWVASDWRRASAFAVGVPRKVATNKSDDAKARPRGADLGEHRAVDRRADLFL